MSRVIALDTGPLSLLTNPKKSADTIACVAWSIALLRAGHQIIVPAIADYELRRELERAGKTRGLALLDAWNAARSDRYLSVTDTSLRLAARLWAQARNAGTPTADPKELDGDALIAAQLLDLSLPISDFILATTNVGHLSQFVPAALWTDIAP